MNSKVQLGYLFYHLRMKHLIEYREQSLRSTNSGTPKPGNHFELPFD